MTASYKNGSITLPNATRNGYTFEGWYTSATGGELVGKSGATYTPTSTKTLYAQWKKTITITYNANGGSNAPSSQTATVYNSTTSYTFTLRTTKPTREGYVFAGWATSATSTTINWQPGDTVKFDSSQTLYAVWAVAQMRLNGVINYYTSLASAVNSAPDNTETTVLLLVNRTEPTVTVPNTKNIDLDLNNKILTSTLTNEGTLKVHDGTIQITSSYAASTSYAIYNKGTAEIINGTYIMETSTSDRWTIVNDGGATMTITNGTFNNSGTGVCVYNRGKLTMNGGTINAPAQENVYGIVTASSSSSTEVGNSTIRNVTINTNCIGITSGMDGTKGITNVYDSYINAGLYQGFANYELGTLVFYDCEGSKKFWGNVVEVITDSSGFDVYLYDLGSNITAIFPNWTSAEGQDDMIWENGTYIGNRTWHYRVDRSRHNNESGEYVVAVYKYENSQAIIITHVYVTYE